MVGLSRHFGFAFGGGEFGNVLVGFLGELLDARTQAIVVGKFVLTFLDALVDVGEVGAEAGDWFKHTFPVHIVVLAPVFFFSSMTYR